MGVFWNPEPPKKRLGGLHGDYTCLPSEHPTLACSTVLQPVLKIPRCFDNDSVDQDCDSLQLDIIPMHNFQNQIILLLSISF